MTESWRNPQPQKKPKNYAAQADATQVNNAASTQQNINLSPIGIVHSPYKERFGTPRQPAYAVQDAQATIKLNQGFNYEQALQDLDAFSHIWVVYWMHLNQGWNPLVKPPRDKNNKHGVFSTRAPHRPNSIGLSLVELGSIQGRELHILNHDMLDGTPILDIKPYIKEADMAASANNGWIDKL